MKKFPLIRTALVLIAAATLLFAMQACVFLIPFQFKNFAHGLFGLFLETPQKIKSQQGLEQALSSVQHDGVSYHFELVLDDGTHHPYSYGPDVVIKTDKVMTTRLARKLSKDGPTPDSASLTHRMFSTNSKDISTVLKEIKEETN